MEQIYIYAGGTALGCLAASAILTLFSLAYLTAINRNIKKLTKIVAEQEE